MELQTTRKSDRLQEMMCMAQEFEAWMTSSEETEKQLGVRHAQLKVKTSMMYKQWESVDALLDAAKTSGNAQL